jgi:CheY-like chemotaxis protein
VFTDTPIVALTAHALDSERVQALAEGFDEVVSKPCLPNELVDLIERLLAAA